MKKRSIAARLGVFALALTLITTSLSSGTFAKYTNTYDGKFTVLIAKWNTSAQVEYSSGGSTAKKLLGTSKARITDLADTATTKPVGVKDGYIAPGMSGSFKVRVSNYNSAGTFGTDVTVHYTVKITASDTVFPDTFKFNSKAVTTSPTTVAEGYIASTTAAKLDGGTEISVDVPWNWDDSDDASDMAVIDAINGASTELNSAPYFLVEVTLEQDNTHNATSKVS